MHTNINFRTSYIYFDHLWLQFMYTNGQTRVFTADNVMAGTNIHNRKYRESGSWDESGIADRMSMPITPYDYTPEWPINGKATIVVYSLLSQEEAYEVSRAAAGKQNLDRGLNTGELWTSIVDVLGNGDGPHFGQKDFLGASVSDASATTIAIRQRVTEPIVAAIRRAKTEKGSCIWVLAEKFCKGDNPTDEEIIRALDITAERLEVTARKDGKVDEYSPVATSKASVPVDERTIRPPNGAPYFHHAIPTLLLFQAVLSHVDGVEDARAAMSNIFTQPGVTVRTLCLAHVSVRDTVDILWDGVMMGPVINELIDYYAWTEAFAKEMLKRIRLKYKKQLYARIMYQWMLLLGRYGVDPAATAPPRAHELASWVRFRDRALGIPLADDRFDGNDLDAIAGGRKGEWVYPSFLQLPLLELVIVLFPWITKRLVDRKMSDAFRVDQELSAFKPIDKNKRGIFHSRQQDLKKHSFDSCAYMKEEHMPVATYEAVLNADATTGELPDVAPSKWARMFVEEEGKALRRYSVHLRIVSCFQFTLV